jgi:hypothetical protein
MWLEEILCAIEDHIWSSIALGIWMLLFVALLSFEKVKK